MVTMVTMVKPGAVFLFWSRQESWRRTYEKSAHDTTYLGIMRRNSEKASLSVRVRWRSRIMDLKLGESAATLAVSVSLRCSSLRFWPVDASIVNADWKRRETKLKETRKPTGFLYELVRGLIKQFTVRSVQLIDANLCTAQRVADWKHVHAGASTETTRFGSHACVACFRKLHLQIF